MDNQSMPFTKPFSISSQGFIDANGDAEGNYTVVTLFDEEGNLTVQPVGYFQYTTNNEIPVRSFSLKK